MARSFADIEFGYEDVLLDGNEFTRCQFRNSRLIFRGDALPAFHECVIGDDVDFILAGPALVTLQLLAMLYHGVGGAGAQAVERLFDQLRRGEFR